MFYWLINLTHTWLCPNQPNHHIFANIILCMYFDGKKNSVDVGPSVRYYAIVRYNGEITEATEIHMDQSTYVTYGVRDECSAYERILRHQICFK